MSNEILGIKPPPFPVDAKIFNCTDDEGNIMGEPYSYEDFIYEVKAISGVNEELLGPSTTNPVETARRSADG